MMSPLGLRTLDIVRLIRLLPNALSGDRLV